MNMDEKLLELLDEEEINVVIQHVDINLLLMPMKRNQITYSQQVKRLGRMDAKTSLVQKLLPGMVVTLVLCQDLVQVKMRNFSF